MTSIEWTDETWNPIRARRKDGTGKVGWACVRVSPGCVNCYAARQNEAAWAGGTGLDYTVPDLAKVDVFLDERVLEQPLRWRLPRKVFVCSMTDLFGEWMTYRDIRRVFDVMRSCDGGITAATGRRRPRHIFQVLTKRARRMRELAESRALGFDPSSPPDNIWMGVSVENQEAADERIPHLLATPAAVRFLSCEPLLGPVDISKWTRQETGDQRFAREYDCTICVSVDEHSRSQHGQRQAAEIDWVIAGGESGPRARPFDLAWARSLRDQCAAAGVSFFMKQAGSNPVDQGRPVCHDGVTSDGDPIARLGYRESHGRNPDEWPDDLRVREWPRPAAPAPVVRENSGKPHLSNSRGDRG